jgi:preprotein translocase subunit SecE
MNIFGKIISFFKDVGLEMKKVNWPTKSETFRNTLIVIGVCLIVAIFLGGFDRLFTFLLDKFIL